MYMYICTTIVIMELLHVHLSLCTIYCPYLQYINLCQSGFFLQIAKLSFSRFLHMVSLRSDANKMNHGNLGTVFGPNLMTPAVHTYMYTIHAHDTWFSNRLLTQRH